MKPSVDIDGMEGDVQTCIAACLLNEWQHFHDWTLDSIKIGPNFEPRTLCLGLYRQEMRVALEFAGVTCVVVEQLGLLNIVFSVQIADADDPNHERAKSALAQGERLTERRTRHSAFVYSTLGAELAVEFDSLSIERA